MSDYKRFISYIYAYDRGIKSKNVGFAKMEVRDGECRITIKLKGAFAASGRELESYLFYRRQELLIGIKIGSLSVKNGSGESYIVTSAGNICGSGFSLEQMSGIMLCHNEERVRVYASGWDDNGVVPEMFIPANQAMTETAFTLEKEIEKEEVQVAELTPVMEAVEEELAKLTASLDAAQTELNYLLPEQEPKENKALLSEKESEEPEENKTLIVEQRPAESEEIRQMESGEPDSEEITEQEQPQLSEHTKAAVREETEMPQAMPGVSVTGRDTRVHNGLWGSLERQFPNVTAFADEPEILCLKIDLKDLECLPRENWGLANNSFLLHGYYNFRYLILAKMSENQYMIGVPGMFHNNERFMAAMFGFDHFKPVKEYKPLTGHFGYWYQWITM